MNLQNVFVATFILVSATLFVGCGSTKFSSAVREGDTSTVKSMLDQGEMDVNKEIGFGTTAIFFALEEDNDEMVRLLLEKGARVDVRDDEGRGPITMAAKEGKNDLVKDMVEASGKPDAKGEDGMTALMIYVQKRDGLPMVKYLVEKGADVNAKKDDWMQGSFYKWPLDMAMGEDNMEVTKYLIEKGAKIRTVTIDNALRKDREWGMAMLEAKESVPSDLLLSHIDDDELFNYLLDRGADPTSQIERAAGTGSIKALRKLVEAGGEFRDPWNPLEEAKNAETARVLVELGADVDRGFPVHEAVMDEDAERVRFLVNEAGADINKQDTGRRPIGDQTPMHVAAYRNKYDMLKVLLECKGPHKFNLKNEEGKTVVDYVADSQLKKTLLDKGAKSTQY
ncbi:MAG: ankyrin repeat domain-containing protein [Bacteroidota bacterium]